MPITTVHQDPDALSLTIVGEFPVSRDRLWEAWLDPRQLERFWGPPTWPATFTRHEARTGTGSSTQLRPDAASRSPKASPTRTAPSTTPCPTRG